MALLEDFGEQLPDEGRNYLMRIRTAAQRMARLIDDLLDLRPHPRATEPGAHQSQQDRHASPAEPAAGVA